MEKTAHAKAEPFETGGGPEWHVVKGDFMDAGLDHGARSF